MTTASIPQTVARKIQPLTASVMSVMVRDPRQTAERRVASRFLHALLRSLAAVQC